MTSPVLRTVASKGEGVVEVVDRFEEHLVFLRESGDLERRRRRRLEQRLRDLLRDQLWTEFHERVASDDWARILAALADRAITPHAAAGQLIALARNGV